MGEVEVEEAFALGTEAEEGQEAMVTNLTERAAGKRVDSYNHIFLVNAYSTFRGRGRGY